MEDNSKREYNYEDSRKKETIMPCLLTHKQFHFNSELLKRKERIDTILTGLKEKEIWLNEPQPGETRKKVCRVQPIPN